MNYIELDDTHVSEIENIENAREFISEALDCLYGSKSLDHLEFALQEACAYLEIPYPKGELKIEKKNLYFEIGVAMSRHQAQVLNRTTGE